MKVISATILNCEKAQQKFTQGTSQYSLLKNRINALYLAKALITNDHTAGKYTKKEFEKALPPVSSIISKCKKAQLKFAEGTPYHTRLKNIINAMNLSKALITEEIDKTDDR